MTLMFRAYDCKNNKWLHGYTPGQEGCYIDGEIVLMGGWLSEISLLDLNNIHIEQFTGIYDKKGIPIFVGDYVKATSLTDHPEISKGTTLIDQVDFSAGRFYIQGMMSFLDWFNVECEVVGNIHDNPEYYEEHGL